MNVFVYDRGKENERYSGDYMGLYIVVMTILRILKKRGISFCSLFIIYVGIKDVSSLLYTSNLEKLCWRGWIICYIL